MVWTAGNEQDKHVSVCAPVGRSGREIYVCDLFYITAYTSAPHIRFIYISCMQNTLQNVSFRPMTELNRPGAETATFLRMHYIETNSSHYSWPYSRGHCHGVYFFFLPL